MSPPVASFYSNLGVRPPLKLDNGLIIALVVYIRMFIFSFYRTFVSEAEARAGEGHLLDIIL